MQPVFIPLYIKFVEMTPLLTKADPFIYWTGQTESVQPKDGVFRQIEHVGP